MKQCSKIRLTISILMQYVFFQSHKHLTFIYSLFGGLIAFCSRRLKPPITGKPLVSLRVIKQGSTLIRLGEMVLVTSDSFLSMVICRKVLLTQLSQWILSKWITVPYHCSMCYMFFMLSGLNDVLQTYPSRRYTLDQRATYQASHERSRK